MFGVFHLDMQSSCDFACYTNLFVSSQTGSRGKNSMTVWGKALGIRGTTMPILVLAPTWQAHQEDVRFLTCLFKICSLSMYAVTHWHQKRHQSMLNLSHVSCLSFFCSLFYSNVMEQLSSKELRRRLKQPSPQANIPYLLMNQLHLPISPAKGKEKKIV